MGLQDTPRANRPHIGLFGNRNAGKSSLLNAITGQAKSLVSPVEGTTTDLVYQTFELERLGPVVFIDTAGLDDTGPLGTLRVEKTRQAVDTMDLAILVLTGPMKEELSWFQWLQEKKVPILPVLNQCDRMENVPAVQAYLSQQLGGLPVFPVAQKQGNRFRSFARPSRKPFQMIFGSLPSPALWRSPVIWFCWSCLRIFKPPKDV